MQCLLSVHSCGITQHIPPVIYHYFEKNLVKGENIHIHCYEISRNKVEGKKNGALEHTAHKAALFLNMNQDSATTYFLVLNVLSNIF